MARLRYDGYFGDRRVRMSCGFNAVCKVLATWLLGTAHGAVDAYCPCRFFAFRSIEMSIPSSWNTAAMALALLTIGIDGFLKLRGSDRGFERTNSAR
jgi:hypothetical protein